MVERSHDQPRTSHPATRRGVALILVLAALLLVSTSLGALARLAATSALAAEHRARAAEAGLLLREAEAPILRWLVRESHRTVLPPEAEVPAVPLLCDTWVTGEAQVALCITGFDQRGMPSQSLLLPGSPMRSAVPPQALARLESVPAEVWGRSPGLDRLSADGAPGPYPQHGALPSRAFGLAQRPHTAGTAATAATGGAVGAYVATHNPPPRQDARRGGPPQAAINVRTAPAEVVRHALRMAGRSGLEEILDARARGVGVGPVGPPAGEPHPLAPIIISTSDCWAFRVDATVGAVARSCWLVYARHDSGWRLLQRLDIAS